MQKTPPRAKEWSKSKSSALERKFVITFIRQMWQGILESSSLYLISRMGRSRAHWGGVLFYIGESQNFSFFQTRKYSKNVKKSMKHLQLWENFQIYIQKSQWLLIFCLFFLPSSRTFVILYTSGTYQNVWGWFGWGGVVPPSLVGVLSILGVGAV